MSGAAPGLRDVTLAHARSLRAAGSWTEAETLLEHAVGLWPDDAELLVDRALLSQEQMRWADMAERFAVLRARCPDHLFGYARTGEALRALGQPDAADAAICAGLQRFPAALELLIQWVLAACERAAAGTLPWSEAETRATALVERLPDEPAAWRFAAEAFLRQGRHEAGELILAEGLHLLGPVPALVLRFAEAASERQDWPAAARRWRAAYRHLPSLPETHRALAAALLQAGQTAAAETVIGTAAAAFPEAPGFAVEYAWMATRREAWDEAAIRWQGLQAHRPDDPAVMAGLMHLAAVTGRDLAAPGHAPARCVAPNMDDPASVMRQFESIGESCEFGLVQRHFGIEPISLMRWAATGYRQLLHALDSDFAGLGAPENTAIRIGQNDEYIVNDVRLGFDMHTFVRAVQVDATRFLDSQARRLRFLVRRFREDAALAERVLVRGTDKPTSIEEIRVLHQALRRHGPVTLLHVMQATDGHQPGDAERLGPALVIGWVERIGLRPGAAWDIAFPSWLALCRAALALRAAA